MEKKAFSGIMLALLLAGILTFVSQVPSARAEPRRWTVDDDGPADFQSIQEAIDAASAGDTVFVYRGMYYESVMVSKTISLIGESKSDTVISAGPSSQYQGTVVVTASDVMVKGFTIRNDVGHYSYGVFVWNLLPMPPPFPMNVTIENNLIMNNTVGVLLQGRNHRIIGNTIMFNSQGVSVQAPNSSIINNEISNNFFGLGIESNNNLLRENRIDDNSFNLIVNGHLYWFMSDYSNDIDTSNTINGKPVYYLVKQTKLTINPDTFPNVGYLGLIDSSNITINGLTLANNGQGILLSGSSNITLEGNIIENNLMGIQATGLSYSSLLGNRIWNNYHGLTLYKGGQNELAHNTIENNTIRLFPYELTEFPSVPLRSWIIDDLLSVSGGIFLRSGNNTFVDNTILNNENGIQLYQSSFNIFRNNNMTGNVYNIGFPYHVVLVPPEWTINPPSKPHIPPYLMNDIDTSNTVDGKPIYYLINHKNEQIPSDAGYVVLVNSTNMVARDLTLQNNIQGMFLFDTSNTTIANSHVSNALYGIQLTGYFLRNSQVNNVITENDITRTGMGIVIWGSGGTLNLVSDNFLQKNLAGIFLGADRNNVTDNICSDNAYPPMDEWILGWLPPRLVPELYYLPGAAGIILESSDNVIVGNTLENNEYAMSLGFPGRSSGNMIYHNNFINSSLGHLDQMFWDTDSLTWDDGYPSGGNYWSDYEGLDLHSGPYQNMTGSDGIGDTPYFVSWYNLDNYPLMKPWGVAPPIPTTLDELKAKIEEFRAGGEIDRKGVAKSLFSKLTTVQKLLDKGKTDEAKTILEEDFIPQVQGLLGIHISLEAADVLIKSAEYVVSHLYPLFSKISPT